MGGADETVDSDLTEEERLAVDEMRAAGVKPSEIIDRLQEERATKTDRDDQNKDPNKVVTRGEVQQVLEERERRADFEQQKARHVAHIRKVIGEGADAAHAGLTDDGDQLETVVAKVGRKLQEAGDEVKSLKGSALDAKLRELAGEAVGEMKARWLGGETASAGEETEDDVEGDETDIDAETAELTGRLASSRRAATAADTAAPPGSGSTDRRMPPPFEHGVSGRSPDNREGNKYPSKAEIRRRHDQRFAAFVKKHGDGL